MDDDRHPVRPDPEQPACLDHLEPLVHQGGGINGDFRPHGPRRVPERILGTDIPQRGSVEPSERPAGRCQDEPLHAVHRAAMQALMDGIVLTVNGEDLDAGAPGAVHDQCPRHDQDLLVGERNPLPGVRRGEHRVEAGSAR